MRVREYQSLASIESAYPTRAGGPEWNNKLEIEAKSSKCPEPEHVIASLFTGRSSKDSMSNLVPRPLPVIPLLGSDQIKFHIEASTMSPRMFDATFNPKMVERKNPASEQVGYNTRDRG
jgi:hypothetical protein